MNAWIKLKLNQLFLYVYSHCNCDFRETMIKLSFDVCHEVMPVQHMIRPAISNSPWQKVLKSMLLLIRDLKLYNMQSQRLI